MPPQFTADTLGERRHRENVCRVGNPRPKLPRHGACPETFGDDTSRTTFPGCRFTAAGHGTAAHLLRHHEFLSPAMIRTHRSLAEHTPHGSTAPARPPGERPAPFPSRFPSQPPQWSTS